MIYDIIINLEGIKTSPIYLSEFCRMAGNLLPRNEYFLLKRWLFFFPHKEGRKGRINTNLLGIPWLRTRRIDLVVEINIFELLNFVYFNAPREKKVKHSLILALVRVNVECFFWPKSWFRQNYALRPQCQPSFHPLHFSLSSHTTSNILRVKAIFASKGESTTIVSKRQSGLTCFR